MDIYKFKEKLKRNLDGTANETENALIDAWYRSYSTEEKILAPQEAEDLRNNIYGNINAATKKNKVRYLVAMRIAASVAIFATLSFIVWRLAAPTKSAAKYYIVETGTQRLKQINLPDGSVAWLNAASRLQIPVSFDGDTRTVKLLEGEGFFEIKKQDHLPFIVVAGKLNVQVLGTSFNVKNYQKLSAVIVSVATGKVGVTQNGQLLAMLLPGQRLNYDVLTKSYHQQSASPEQAQSWKNGYTDLEEANFKQLALSLKNMFGITIKTSDQKIKTYHFSLRLSRQVQSAQLLKIISQLHHTHFRKEGDDIMLY